MTNLPQTHLAIKYSNLHFMAGLLTIASILVYLLFIFVRNEKKSEKLDLISTLSLGIRIYSGILVIRIISSIIRFRINMSFDQTTMSSGTFFFRLVKVYSIELILITLLCAGFYYFYSKTGSFALELSISMSILYFLFMFSYPVLIQPLFFEGRPVKSEQLNRDVQELAEKFNIEIDKVYVINASKYTKKTNAYVSGLFSSLRVVLYDNLLKRFPRKEILGILAHEFAHYKLNHLYLMLFTTIIFIFSGWFLIEKLFFLTSGKLQEKEKTDVLSSDLFRLFLLLYLVINLLNPLGNYIERHGEAEADRYAVKITSMKKEISNSLIHLYEDNLSHPSPHPVLKFLFYTHFPPVERLNMIKKL